MSKQILSLIAAASFLATIAAPASAARVRTVTEEYSKPAAGLYIGAAQSGVWYYNCLEGTGCVHIPVRSGEQTVDIRVDDAAGTPVAVKVFAYMGGEIAEFCTFSDESIPVAGVGELLVMVVNGNCENGQPSVVTTGTVTAEFRR